MSGIIASLRRGFREPDTRLFWMALLLVLLGVLARTVQFTSGRALWVDEILLAANILDRPLSDLLSRPLDHNQGAPLGFLAVERALVSLLGDRDAVLRLFPFLCGIALLPLMWMTARAALSPRAVPIALALAALSPSLVYYSAEVKQYETDGFVAVALIAIALPGVGGITSCRRAGLALAGVVAVWLSHPSVFVLAAIGIALLHPRLGGDVAFGHRVRRAALVVVPWLLSFGAAYALSLRHLTANQSLLDYWDRGFPPTILPVPGFWTWLLAALTAFFKFPAGAHFPPAGALTSPSGVNLSTLALFAALVGAGVLLRRRTDRGLILALPFLFVILAATLGKFPFLGRVVLVLVPLTFLLVAEGVFTVWRRARVVGIVLGALILLHPTLTGVQALRAPYRVEEVKPLLRHLKREHEPGDMVYIYYGAEAGYRFYAEREGLGDIPVVYGSESRNYWRGYEAELASLAGNARTWVFFSHVCTWRGVDEERFFVQYLNRMGKKIDRRGAWGGSLHLYDLTGDASRDDTEAR